MFRVRNSDLLPRGSIYTTIMELGPQNHNGDGLLGANSIIVVDMDPLGWDISALLPDIIRQRSLRT